MTQGLTIYENRSKSNFFHQEITQCEGRTLLFWTTNNQNYHYGKEKGSSKEKKENLVFSQKSHPLGGDFCLLVKTIKIV
ncbi:MAG: hypothetical protein Q8R40_03310 [bacterium]|nr:hypothetical protein [bacterium]